MRGKILLLAIMTLLLFSNPANASPSHLTVSTFNWTYSGARYITSERVGNDQVLYLISPSATIVGFFANGTSSGASYSTGLVQPRALTWDNTSQHFWVLDNNDKSIYKVWKNGTNSLAFSQPSMDGMTNNATHVITSAKVTTHLRAFDKNSLINTNNITLSDFIDNVEGLSYLNRLGNDLLYISEKNRNAIHVHFANGTASELINFSTDFEGITIYEDGTQLKGCVVDRNPATETIRCFDFYDVHTTLVSIADNSTLNIKYFPTNLTLQYIPATPDLVNATLYTNGSWLPRQTDASPINLTTNNFTQQFNNTGAFEWNVLVCDSTLCEFAISNFTFTLQQATLFGNTTLGEPNGTIQFMNFPTSDNFYFNINMNLEGATARLYTNETGSFIMEENKSITANGTDFISHPITEPMRIQWFIQLIDQENNTFNSETNETATYEYIPSNITMALAEPDAESFVQYSDILFNYSVNSSRTILNATLYTDENGIWENRTTDLTVTNGTTNTIAWNETFVGTFNWNVRICDSLNCSSASANKTFTTIFATQGLMSDIVLIPSGNSTILWLDYEFRQNGSDVLGAICEVTGDIEGYVFYNATSSRYENDYTAFGLGDKSYTITCTKAEHETQIGTDLFTIFSEGLEVKQLKCDTSDFHFLSISGLSDDTLYWYCTFETDLDYKCYTQVYDTNQTGMKVAGALIQTYPETVYLENSAIDRFESDGQIVKVHFGSDNVKPDTDYIYTVKCYNNETFGVDEHLVRVEFNDLSQVGGYGVLFKNNVGYIIGGILIFVMFLLVGDYLWDYIRRTR